MKRRTWFQAAIRIEEKYQDLIIGQLALIGFTGFVQEQAALQCIIPNHRWNQTVKNKFEALIEKFNFEFPSLDLSYSGSIVHEKNWNKQWEKQTGIVLATPRIIIKPSWKKLSNHTRSALIIHIDPKMSFGTGHHETTRLCLRLLERFIKPGMKVLDFGTGTGILGIASIKLGAKSTFAIDNDEWAIENAKENVISNHVQKQIRVKLGSMGDIPRRKFDLIVANIDYRTISRFISSLAERIRKHGIIIFSGILTSDLLELNIIFAKNALAPLDSVKDNEWTAVALQRM